MLHVELVSKRFGGITAVDRLSLEAGRAEVLGIIGPNGSGKTTLLNLINGVTKPDTGSILLNNKPIHLLKPHQIAMMGVGRTFQITKVFKDLSVIENMLAPISQNASSRQGLYKKAGELLRLVNLSDKLYEKAGTLSGGQQKLLEFARALMLEPEILLLDEPFAGVHPSIVSRLVELIMNMKKEGKTFLIVSHDIHTISWISDRLIVMSDGRKIAEGKPEEIQADREVIRHYLGV
ncbi:MAG: ABC transporter ATP-binding protein [Candidatus Caldarchaeum sp.]